MGYWEVTIYMICLSQVALCQMLVSDNKEANIKAAKEAVTKAAKTGAKIVALPGTTNYHNSFS